MGWNRPSQSADGHRAKSRGRGGRRNAATIHGVAALGIVVAGAFGVWVLAKSGRETARSIADETAAHGMIGDESRARARAQGPADGRRRGATGQSEGGNATEASPIAGGTQAVTQTESVVTNSEIKAQLEKFRKEPVKGLAEQLIMMVAPPKKGEIVPPPPIGIAASPELEREAQAMLERQGVIEDWDDEDSIGVKERLEALKDEWYAFKKAGGTFHEFLQKRLRASNFDTETLEDARKFDSESFHDSSVSDEEYEKLHGRVNKILEMQGFDKIERPNAEPKIEEELE